tara:strand:+ start:1857 stop:2063 length:207 start_codon:yes stop_codon:yes gene_type:complete
MTTETKMLEINTTKNKDLGLWDITATLTLPPITVTRLKKDKSDIEYELRDAFTDVIQEIVEKHCEDEV